MNRKTVLITGSNRGIGLGLVKGYLGVGYRVIATCRNIDLAVQLTELLTKHPNQLLIEKLDVNKQSDFTELSTKYSLEQIDTLINNAGVYPEDHSPLGIEFTDPEQVLLAFQTNAVGALMSMQAFQKNLLKSPNPKIINLSSLMGALSAADGFGYAYRMSKVALNMLTKSFAMENNKIITIALRPGWVKTSMGGAGANLSIEDSIAKVIPLIDSLTLIDSGCFLDNEKNICEW